MKKIIFIFAIFVFAGTSVFAQTVAAPKKSSKPAETFTREKFDPTRNANTDLQTAITSATKDKKRIILDVGGEWCGWCIQMDKFFALNADLTKLRDENFVWVKVNMSEENENKEFLSKYPTISGYPHLFVLEKDGTLLKSKDTVELEEGKTYNLKRFTDFLKEFAPAKTTAN